MTKVSNAEEGPVKWLFRSMIGSVVLAVSAERHNLYKNTTTMRTTVIALLCPLAATAQPVIEYTNGELSGKTFAVHLVTDAGTSDPDPNGADIMWDFSSATLLLNAGSTSFMDPEDSFFGANYPTSNLAQSITTPGGTTYGYFTINAEQMDMLAEGVGGTNEQAYTDPKTLLVFPFAYEDVFVDNYTADGTDYSDTHAYVGYGTVVLPTGTYTDVVKVTNTAGAIDFYRSNPVEPLVHIEEGGQVLVFTLAQAAVEEQRATASLSAWPNPSADLVRIAGLTNAGRWQLVDAQGRVHQRGNYRPGTLSLDLAPLASGCYTLVTHDGDRTQRVLLSRQ